MSEALAVLEKQGPEEPQPHGLMKRATEAAGACGEIVKKTALTLGKKQYVRVEGWQSIAAVFGCYPSIREVVEEERGVRAVAEIRNSAGAVIASAEGYCGLDEPDWANRATYARRGMAQTRAVSRVCRSVFAFVVTMIDAGLSTTPAEEIPHAAEADIIDVPRPTAPGAVLHLPASTKPAPAPGLEQYRIKANKVRYGRTRGQYLCDIPQEDIDWQLAAARKGVEANDPRWGEANKTWLAIVEAEVARRVVAK